MRSVTRPARYSPDWIRTLFDRIAGRYDLLNDLLSLGIHRLWKRAAISELGNVSGCLVLDAATGTGDLAVRLANLGARVTGVDFSREMLEIARKKSTSAGSVEFRQEDVLNLRFADGTFDHAIIAFGVRNFEAPDRGIQELWRVLKPGGRLVILEFGSWSERPVLRRMMQGLIRLVTSDREAYAHLLESSIAFPGGQKFVGHYLKDLPKQRGGRFRPLFFGLAYLYTLPKVAEYFTD